MFLYPQPPSLAEPHRRISISPRLRVFATSARAAVRPAPSPARLSRSATGASRFVSRVAPRKRCHATRRDVVSPRAAYRDGHTLRGHVEAREQGRRHELEGCVFGRQLRLGR